MLTQLVKYTLVFTLPFFSCTGKLDVNNNTNPQGYADSQLVGVWKITGFSSSEPFDWNNDGRPESNIYNTWTECQKDNLYQFNADKTGISKLNCSLTTQSTWQIINSTYLYFTPIGQSPETEKIIAMTSVQFNSTKDLTVSTGKNITVTKIWTRQ